MSQAAAEAILATPMPGVVALGQYRGDFQMHSTWSDGGQTLERIVEAGLRLGHTCAGVTDHGHGLPIARGMSMEAVARQHAAIDALNERHGGAFRLFKGIEANIRADGTIDMDDSPVEAVRNKPDSSISVMCKMAGKGQADVVISAGNTGACVAGAQLRMRTLAGVSRPVTVMLAGRVNRVRLVVAVSLLAWPASPLVVVHSRLDSPPSR